MFLLCPDLLPSMRGAAPPIPRGGSTETPPTGVLVAEEKKKIIYLLNGAYKRQQLQFLCTSYLFNNGFLPKGSPPRSPSRSTLAG